MHRRSFILSLWAILNGLMAAVVALPGVHFLIDPLKRKRKTNDFIRVAPLSAITTERPVRLTVHADRWDAYIHHPTAPIGAVWLQQSKRTNDEPIVRCWQTICPHLGCGINWMDPRKAFVCPCHASEFEADGKAKFGPSPRAMDPLECRVTPPDETGARWVEVKYQEFETGVPDQRPILQKHGEQGLTPISSKVSQTE